MIKLIVFINIHRYTAKVRFLLPELKPNFIRVTTSKFIMIVNNFHIFNDVECIFFFLFTNENQGGRVMNILPRSIEYNTPEDKGITVSTCVFKNIKIPRDSEVLENKAVFGFKWEIEREIGLTKEIEVNYLHA